MTYKEAKEYMEWFVTYKTKEESYDDENFWEAYDIIEEVEKNVRD